jgi:hypothetical protein
MEKKMKTELKVELLFKGNNFNPEDFSKAVGINPSKTWREGSIGKYKGCHSYDLWEYNTGTKETLDLDGLMQEIYENFNPKKEIIKSLINKYSLDVSLNIIVGIVNKEIPDLTIEKSLIELLSFLNGEIGIDTYLY